MIEDRLRKVPWSGCRLDLGKLVLASQLKKTCRLTERIFDHWMPRTCDERIVIKVENPAGIIRLGTQKHSGLHHCSSSDVVTEWLEFEPPILSQPADVGTDAYIVRIDIDAAFN